MREEWLKRENLEVGELGRGRGERRQLEAASARGSREGLLSYLLEITMSLCFKYFLRSSRLTVGYRREMGEINVLDTEAKVPLVQGGPNLLIKECALSAHVPCVRKEGAGTINI